MATQAKSDKATTRNALPAASAKTEPANEASSAKPIAQWEDTFGDRLVYLFWMTCFGLMGIFVLVETLLGFLRML